MSLSGNSSNVTVALRTEANSYDYSTETFSSRGKKTAVTAVLVVTVLEVVATEKRENSGETLYVVY